MFHRDPRLLVAVFAVILAGVLTAPSVSPVDAAEVRPMTLPIHPDRVDDVHWSDTWGASRGGGRSHIGVDMLGPKMIPLLAVRDARVTWGRFDNGRGSILRLRDDEGWEYQYIHLNNDNIGTDDGAAPCELSFSARLCTFIDGDGDFTEEVRVSEGEVVAYLGDGGNAEWTASHLHFEIYKPVPGGGVEPINPTPSVDAALQRIRDGVPSWAAPPEAEPGQEGFTDHLWYRLHGRYPTADEKITFQATVADQGIWSALAGEVDAHSTAATVDRLYLAFFLRYPDSDGIRYWLRVSADGHSLEDIAEWFAESNEYQTRYEGMNFSQFLDQLYEDVLHREPDLEGKEYWLDLLEQGRVTRGTIVVYFTESAEMQGLSAIRNEIVGLSLVRDGATPTAAEVAAWEALRSSSSSVGDAVAAWYAS